MRYAKYLGGKKYERDQEGNRKEREPQEWYDEEKREVALVSKDYLDRVRADDAYEGAKHSHQSQYELSTNYSSVCKSSLTRSHAVVRSDVQSVANATIARNLTTHDGYGRENEVGNPVALTGRSKPSFESDSQRVGADGHRQQIQRLSSVTGPAVSPPPTSENPAASRAPDSSLVATSMVSVSSPASRYEENAAPVASNRSANLSFGTLSVIL
jgi:hypothetical protein